MHQAPEAVLGLGSFGNGRTHCTGIQVMGKDGNPGGLKNFHDVECPVRLREPLREGPELAVRIDVLLEFHVPGHGYVSGILSAAYCVGDVSASIDQWLGFKEANLLNICQNSVSSFPVLAHS